MNLIDQPCALLGHLSPATFMRRHWQKKPALVRSAVDVGAGLITRADLFALAEQPEVASRLVVRQGKDWRLMHGPLKRRRYPRLDQPGWTLLVQGVDLHVQALHDLLCQFHFVPAARLDDVMVSWASEGGGVGPHVDSYDVFLVQLQGRRRWRVGPLHDASLQPGLPLKILQHFEPTQTWVLEPGDMLYVPPGWAHDGVAQDGPCMTASVGFRAPAQQVLGQEILQYALDAAEPLEADKLYQDRGQLATLTPGQIPPALAEFALASAQRWLNNPQALACALGEVLSEPKPQVYFEPTAARLAGQGVALDRRTRMLYDTRHVFINGESFRASGQDAKLMRHLADARALCAKDVSRLSQQALALLDEWVRAGWLKTSLRSIRQSSKRL